jgi:hypothetical protein
MYSGYKLNRGKITHKKRGKMSKIKELIKYYSLKNMTKEDIILVAICSNIISFGIGICFCILVRQ